jgi:hypothetical protein
VEVEAVVVERITLEVEVEVELRQMELNRFLLQISVKYVMVEAGTVVMDSATASLLMLERVVAEVV